MSTVVIDMDGRIYVRPWQGGLLSGGFEKNPKPIFTEGRNQLEIQNMQEDWDHFGNGEWEGGRRGSFKLALHLNDIDHFCTILIFGQMYSKYNFTMPYFLVQTFCDYKTLNVRF